MKRKEKRKKKRVFKKSFKGLVSLLLALLVCVYSFLADWSLDTAYADNATDRITTFINLAKGQSIVDDSGTVETLTDDELQFLGVYLSNFFIPFYTELGVDADTDETVAQMVEALKKNMDWSDDMAQTLCEEIIGLSRSNSKPLEFRVSHSYPAESYTEVLGFSPNYYNFLRLMLGQYKAVFQGNDMNMTEQTMETTGWMSYNDCYQYIHTYPLADPDSSVYPFKEMSEDPFKTGETYFTGTALVYSKILEKSSHVDDSLNYGYWGYTVGDTFIPVFDCALSDKGEFTASQNAFLNCLNSVDISQGYGFSFFDFTNEEINDSQELLSLLTNDDKADQLYKCSIYNEMLNVDCFGNIIIKGYNHQYIAVPGCMNPYSWVTVNNEGEDFESIPAGNAYNAINFCTMALFEKGNFIDSGNVYPNDFLSNVRTIEFANLPIHAKLNAIKKDETLKLQGHWDASNTLTQHRQVYPLRFARGNSSYNLSTTLTGAATTNNYNGPLNDAINNATHDVSFYRCAMYAQIGFELANPGDRTYFASAYRSTDTNWGAVGFYGVTLSSANSNATDGLINNGMGWKTSAETVSNMNSAYVSCWYDRAMENQVNGDSNKVTMLSGMVAVDNLGAFNSENGGSTDFRTINIISYLDEEGNPPTVQYANFSDPYNGFTNGFQNRRSGEINTQMNVSEAAITSVYSTYLLSSLYTNEGKADTIAKLGFRMNREGLPSIENSAIGISNEIREDAMNDAIRNWTYYLLHPTKGLKYVKTLIKNKSQAILVDWHNDMVGTNDVGVTTGTTTYRSNMGYVTTPDLTEISWASKALNVYGKCIPYLILAMIILMLFTYIIGIMPLQKAAFGVIIFSAFLFLPPVIINSVVSISNNVVQEIYGSRFTYWAVVQQESYAGALDDAITEDSYENYLRSLYALNNETYNNQGGDSIVLKWQAPKKSASLIFTQEDSDLLNGLRSSSLVSYALNRNTMSGQNFAEDDSAYLYRSYTDLSNTSRFVYQGIDIGNVPSKGTISSNGIGNSFINGGHSTDVESTDATINERIMKVINTYSAYVNSGYSNPLKSDSTNIENAIRLRTATSSNIYEDAFSTDLSQISSLNTETAPGINQDVFNYSLPVFNNESLKFSDVLSVQNNATPGNYNSLINYIKNYGYAEGYTNTDFEKEMTSLASYALMSESSYYYFSWCLYDQGMSYRSGVKNGYKTLLLSGKDGSFFYNTKGNGELKDFMDMRTLFTVIIPYLKKGNDLVREFDDKYGLELYDGVPTEEGHWEDAGMLDSNGKPTELYKKYWHNVAVARLYEIYTPWVDLMYDCNYAKSEDISVMGKTYTIEDPLDPMCYPEDRPMIFSASEMYDYGLDEADLTEVERRILKTNEGMCDRMFELLNYVTFRDSTLNSAAALECAFEFNSNFSQESITGNNAVIYPQTYEINNFSYDAYLRFILANTTGDDLSASDDFYLTVVKKSSTTTAIMLIVNDIISQYVFQGFKIFFLVAVFVASVLLIIVTAFKIDTDQKYIKKLLKGIAIPLIGFLLVNIIFAGVLAMFMGVGNNAVTQTSRATIQTGDPVIVMLIMIALDILCMICYFKLVKAVIKEIMSNLNLIKGYLGGIAQGTVAFAGGITSKLSNIGKGNGEGSGAYGSNPSEGRVSARADRRASSHNDVDSFSEESDIRRNEAQRETFKQSEANVKGKNGSEKDINQKIDSGERKLNEGNQTEDRRVREGGYAGRSMENLFEGASESMKNISHGASKSVENLSEGLSSMMKSSGKSVEHLSEGVGKSMENSSEALKNMTKKGK